MTSENCEALGWESEDWVGFFERVEAAGAPSSNDSGGEACDWGRWALGGGLREDRKLETGGDGRGEKPRLCSL